MHTLQVLANFFFSVKKYSQKVLSFKCVDICEKYFHANVNRPSRRRNTFSKTITHFVSVFYAGSGAGEQRHLVTREGLLDALLVLYDECNSDCLMKNEYIADFVHKCEFCSQAARLVS